MTLEIPALRNTPWKKSNTMNAPLSSNTAQARMDCVSQLQLQLKTKASFKFFGLSVYEAQLWAPPQFDGERFIQQPFALALHYKRSVEGKLIAEISLAEMRRLSQSMGVSMPANGWLEQMIHAFPNVRAGDCLTGIHQFQNGTSKTIFYFNDQLTQVIEGAAFAQLFFSIWLHKKTSDSHLRQQLLDIRE